MGASGRHFQAVAGTFGVDEEKTGASVSRKSKPTQNLAFTKTCTRLDR